MGRIWVICCEEVLYGTARQEVLKRDGDARIARVASVEEMMSLRVLCESERVGIVVAGRGASLDRTARDVTRIRQQGFGDDVLAILAGCGPGSVARMLRAGANEVIAAEGEWAGCALPDRPLVLGTCMEDDGCGCTVDGAPPFRDDLVPLEELWPPLDEPDDEVGAGPSALERTGDCGISCKGSVRTGRDGVDVPAADAHELKEVAARAGANAAMSGEGHRAPLVAVVSGRGGVGKTTVVAGLAACAARVGLRSAVLDLDLMCGDMPAVLGVDAFKGLEGLMAHESGGSIAECDIEATAMRVGPGLTLWGPLAEGERAELFGDSVEQLIDALRSAADVIFADTSCFWGDAVAVAVGACDRCLVVGGAGETSGASAARAVALAMRLGVPATRMTSVFNWVGGCGSGEEEALRFEMGASLRSRARISDGGDRVSGLLSFGKLDALIAEDCAFSRDMRSFAGELLSELGCRMVGSLEPAPQNAPATKFRLPWGKRGSGER